MIPIPPQLIEFAFSKGGKLVGVLVLLLALAGAYFYWHHQVYKTGYEAVSYTHLRAHETVLDLVCRLLLEKKKNNTYHAMMHSHLMIVITSQYFNRAKLSISDKSC